MCTRENARRRLTLSVAVAIAGYFADSALGNSYFVDPNYAGTNGAAANGYTAEYNSISAALASTGVPSGASAANPNIVYIAPGTYLTTTTTTSLAYSKNNVVLDGISGNPNDVVITSYLDSAFNTGSGTLGTTGSASLQLKGNDITCLNLTFANSTDTPYIVNTGKQTVSPTGAYTGNTAQTANAPAVALLLQGDEQAFQNCNFLGYQDTLYTKGGRTYFNNCTVSGDVDFIFANGTNVFNNSTINLDGDHSGGDIGAPSTDKHSSNGLVFLNSSITANSVHGNPAIDAMNAANVNGTTPNSMYLGRPWWTQTGGDAAMSFINTKMTNAIKPVGYLNWDTTELNSPALNNGNLAEDSRFAEFNSTDLTGNPLDVSQRVAWSHQLTAAQAAAYSVNNIFASSPDTWYGLGYGGVADPTNPNYSWPAFWGPRNVNDENNGEAATNSANGGQPTSYNDPSWTLGGNWDPNAQIASVQALVPEPASASVLLVGGLVISASRRLGRKTRQS